MENLILLLRFLIKCSVLSPSLAPFDSLSYSSHSTGRLVIDKCRNAKKTIMVLLCRFKGLTYPTHIPQGPGKGRVHTAQDKVEKSALLIGLLGNL